MEYSTLIEKIIKVNTMLVKIIPGSGESVIGMVIVAANIQAEIIRKNFSKLLLKRGKYFVFIKLKHLAG